MLGERPKDIAVNKTWLDTQRSKLKDADVSLEKAFGRLAAAGD